MVTMRPCRNGHTLDTDVPGVNGRVSLEIVEAAPRSPGPRSQCTPVFRLARLAVIVSPVTPRVMPAPSSACTLAVSSSANPQPAPDQLPRIGQISVFVHLRNWKRREPLPIAMPMLHKHVLERRILLNSRSVCQALLTLIEFIARRLIRRRENPAPPNHHQYRERALWRLPASQASYRF